MTVVVTDNGDGTLNIDVSYSTPELVFNNTYRASGEWTPRFTKVLENKELLAEMFTFTVHEQIDGVEVFVSETTNDAEGNVIFPQIDYTLDDVGTHIYIIREVEGDRDGIEYSELEITVTVVVTDNGDGTLDVAITYDPETTTFTNVYTAQGSWTPEVTKVLTGRELAEGEFDRLCCPRDR